MRSTTVTLKIIGAIMKKPLAIILGLVLLAILGGQTYMIYRLHQKLNQFPQSSWPEMTPPLAKTPPKDDLFGNGDWDPYREMQRMQNEMERVFGDAFSRFHINQGFDAFTKLPALDLKEEADRYIVKMDVPGGDASSLRVKLEGRQLSVSMKTERRQDNETDRNYQRRERFLGTFQRTLALPGPVKESAMTSDYKDGVLTLIILKA